MQRDVAIEAVTDLVATGAAQDVSSEDQIKRRSAELLDAAFERQVNLMGLMNGGHTHISLL
jgi:hypothetical protein